MNPTKLQNEEAERCCEELKADGWREYPNPVKSYARCFYKQIDTPTVCFGNQDKPGVQIEVSVSEFREFTSMSIELRAGLKDDTWLIIQNYSIPNDVKSVKALIPRLLAVWEASNQVK